MDDFSQALEFKKDFLPAHLAMAVTYERLGMLEKARETLEAAPEETKDSHGEVLLRK